MGSALQSVTEAAPVAIRVRCAFQPLSEAPLLVLDLMKDSTVSVNEGPRHGRWMQLDNDTLHLKFHYLGDTSKEKSIVMNRIAATEVYIAKGDWGAVLAPMTRDRTAAEQGAREPLMP